MLRRSPPIDLSQYQALPPNAAPYLRRPEDPPRFTHAFSAVTCRFLRRCSGVRSGSGAAVPAASIECLLRPQLRASHGLGPLPTLAVQNKAAEHPLPGEPEIRVILPESCQRDVPKSRSLQ
jgi:hypothetical protein